MDGSWSLAVEIRLLINGTNYPLKVVTHEPCIYANYLYTHGGKKEEMAYWLRKSVEGGYINAIGTYALSVAHIPDDLGYPQDLVQAYGLAYLLSKLEGGGIASEDGKEILPEIAEKMTEDQVKQGVAFAKDWEKTRPPLSYYVPIYGY